MTSRWWRTMRSPVVLFLATGLAALVTIAVGTHVLGAHAANDEALSDARATTEVLARSVAEPDLPRGLVSGDTGAIDRFDRVALDRLLVGDVRRVKVWRADGTIVYSDDVRLIGDQFELGDDELEVLRDGGSDAEVSDLTKPENRYENQGAGLVEVYTRIVSPEGEPLLFEAYYSVAGIQARQDRVVAPFQRITLGALAAVVAVATVLLWGLTRAAIRSAAERERLLRSVATASDAERRRIARDLHDGVVQDIAASAFAVTTLARDSDEPARSTLTTTGTSLRNSLRALRSLLVEIHPPGLSPTALRAALEDLSAPAAAAGVRAAVDVGPLGTVSEDSLALVWRVAQEAVRNTLRHAEATRLSIDVARRNGFVTLEITDDGIGFDPDEAREPTHYGLRGLDSLVHDHQGRLTIRTGKGAGTTVLLEVPA